jgi:hypothetical protein
MRFSLTNSGSLALALSGVALLGSMGSLGQAQCPPSCQPPPVCPPLTCPAPAPAQPGQAQPGQPQGQPSTQAQTPTTEPALAAEQAAATGGETVALAAPNMLGNLLGAGNSLSFFYQRAKGSVFINGTGSTSIVNAKVADNNSPLPEDRVYFRYNFFDHSQSVRGDSGQAAFAPNLDLSKFSGPRFQGFPQTRTYDVHDFTFGGEKTFFDGRFSAELRVPFSTTLSRSLDLNVAQISGVGRDNDGDSDHSILQTVSTPENTLGREGTEFGNMTVILKGLAYQSETWAFSGGLSIGIPTARGTHVKVTDFLGDGSDNDIEIQRLRDFRVSNDTWSLSPFLAFLATPSQRWYAQGFLQFDIPVNSSTIHYSEVAVVNTEPNELSLTPLAVTDHIREQTLMQVDLGIGYWVFRNLDNSWINGFAPTLELHYTTTLENADIRTLPTATQSANLAVVGPGGAPIPEPNPTVGNLRNRVDILDLTVGSTWLIANRATFATGFAFPLKTGDDRTFDWEFQLQLNYYFGGAARRSNFAPTSF